MDVLATDLADYLVRKGVRISGTRYYRDHASLARTGTLSGDASHFGAGGGAGRGAPVPARRALGARLQVVARQV